MLRPAEGTSWCEWKGAASYFDLVAGARRRRGLPGPTCRPTPGFEAIAGAIAVMPSQVDRCLVDGEVVHPQPGEFYGGWVTEHGRRPVQGHAGHLGLVAG